jgi:hypothetical protein
VAFIFVENVPSMPFANARCEQGSHIGFDLYFTGRQEVHMAEKALQAVA